MVGTTDEIRELFAYNRWANRRVLDTAGTLTEDELRRPIETSFGSLHDTLAHIAAAEWVWLQRWRGISPRGLPAGTQFDDLAALEEWWLGVTEECDAFLKGLRPEDLTAVLHYTTTGGAEDSAPLGLLMRHVVNHSTYHRGQVTTLLRQLGGKPVATDLIAYYREVIRASPNRLTPPR